MSFEFVALSRRVEIILAGLDDNYSNSLLANPRTIAHSLLDKLGEFEHSPSNLLEAAIAEDLDKLHRYAPRELVDAFETYRHIPYTVRPLPPARRPINPITNELRRELVTIEIDSPEPSRRENLGWCLYYLICIVLAALALLGVYYVVRGEHL